MNDKTISYTTSMELVLIPLLVLSFSGALIGILIGRYTWNRRQAEALKSAPLTATYQLIDKLTPAEFALLYEGKVTDKAVFGNIVYLIQHDILTITKTKTGLKLDFRPAKAKTNEQRSVLHSLRSLKSEYPNHIQITSTLVDTTRSTQKSLELKGWIGSESNSSDFRAFDMRLFVAVLTLLIGSLVSIVLILSPSQPIQIIGAMIGAVTVVLFFTIILIASSIRAFLSSFRNSSYLARRISEKYQAGYKDLHGLYIYLKVSGLDTMTPDYNDLSTIKGLDRLYPYAVAVGLDKQIVKHI